eukprot:3716893-Rhodomonas_salina.1
MSRGARNFLLSTPSRLWFQEPGKIVWQKQRRRRRRRRRRSRRLSPVQVQREVARRMSWPVEEDSDGRTLTRGRRLGGQGSCSNL